MFEALKKFANSSKTQRGHLLFAISTSFIMRVIVLTLPFKWYRRLLGTHLMICDYCPITSQAKVKQAFECGRFTDRISAKLPIGGDCLVSALTFSMYARRFNIPYVIHLGAALPSKISAPIKASELTQESSQKMQTEPTSNSVGSQRNSSPMSAHAWVRVGGMIVSGNSLELADFRIVSSFCHPKHPPIALCDKSPPAQQEHIETPTAA